MWKVVKFCVSYLIFSIFFIFRTKDDVSMASKVCFAFSVLLTSVFLTATLVLTLFWTFMYRGGYAWQVNGLINTMYKIVYKKVTGFFFLHHRKTQPRNLIGIQHLWLLDSFSSQDSVCVIQTIDIFCAWKGKTKIFVYFF